MGYSSQQEETGMKVEEDFVGSDISGNIYKKSNNNNASNNTTADLNGSSVEEDSTCPSHVFQCPEIGCVKTYQTHSSLESHVLLGRHEFKLERKSTYDTIKLRWAEVVTEISSEVRNNLGASCNIRNVDNHENLAKGWALKKEKKAVRFSSDLKEFLTDIFDIGMESGEKVTPSDAAMRIRQARLENGSKRFSVTQYLDAAQITSFFSRLTVSKRKQVQQPKNVLIEDEDLEAVLAQIEDQTIRDIALEN